MDAEKIIFQRVSWSPQVAASLARACYPAQAFIAGEVLSGKSECWYVPGYGYLVTRLEVEPEKKTLVIVAAEGRGLKTITPLYERIAAANEADFIRMHSRRAGMVKMLEPFGYSTQYGHGENIFLKRVSNGRRQIEQ